MALSAVVAVALHTAALAGVVHASLTTELPDLYIYGWGVWLDAPSLHVGELLVGRSEGDVRALLEDAPHSLERGVADGRRCLLYRYASSDLLVLLVERAVVTRAWVTQGEVPTACTGIAEEEVAVAAESGWIGSRSDARGRLPPGPRPDRRPSSRRR
jgi:hypothetical protein